MTGEAQKNIYEYCLKDWKEVELALTDLAQAKDSLAEKGVPNLDKLYRYVFPLYDIVTAGVNNPLWQIQQVILKFLSVDAVRNFLTDPTNTEKGNVLSEQLILIYIATGHQQEDIAPYVTDELKLLVDGNLLYYDDLIFAHTLFTLITKPGDQEKAGALAGFLKAEGGAEFSDLNDWKTIFLLNLVIYTLWTNIDFIDEPFQELLITNYFYVAILIGIPMRSLVVHFAFSGTAEAMVQKKNLMMTSLLNSHEEIPVNLQTGEVKNLGELLKNYGAQLGGEKPSSFTQEEFIKGFYTNQNKREIWRGWLRESLVVMNHLSGS